MPWNGTASLSGGLLLDDPINRTNLLRISQHAFSTDRTESPPIMLSISSIICMISFDTMRFLFARKRSYNTPSPRKYSRTFLSLARCVVCVYSFFKYLHIRWCSHDNNNAVTFASSSDVPRECTRYNGPEGMFIYSDYLYTDARECCKRISREYEIVGEGGWEKEEIESDTIRCADGNRKL